ncbi:MAG: DUF2339 domain-containing protein [Polyangia bacterium]
MEFFLFCMGMLGLWAIIRSVSDRSRLESLQQQLRTLQDTSLEQQQRLDAELQKTRGSVLTLLRAHEALRERLTALQAAPPTPVLPPAPPAAPAPPAPDELPPQSLPPASPAVETTEPTQAAVDAVLSAAADAGLTEAAEPPPIAAPIAPAPSEDAAPGEPGPLPADVFSAPARAAVPKLPPSAPPLAEVPSLTSAGKPFDYEQLLGVRGAAWLGAIALVIAGTLFAKYSIENDLIKPPLRIALLVIAGVGALVGAELGLRRQYAVTANALCSGGVAILYSAFFAAHNLYQLISLPTTFGLLSLTTGAAALLALRHDNLYIAVLGLLGGFATPLALSTGQDRPFSLFGYVLLLDLGFVVLAIRRGWTRLALLTLLLTLFMEAGWASRFLTPEKLPIAVGTAALFGLCYMALPAAGRSLDEAKQRELLHSGAFAGLAPFLLVLALSSQPEYAERWPLLFGLVAILDLGLLVLAVLRWPELAGGALLATLTTHALWSVTALRPSGMPIALATALGFMALFLALPRLWQEVQRRRVTPAAEALPAAPLSLHVVADVAGTAPFGLAVGLAAFFDYARQTALLFGCVLLWCLVLLTVALRRGRPHLVVTASLLAGLVRLVWGASMLHHATRLGAAVATALLVAGLHSVGPRLARALTPQLAVEQAGRYESAARLAWLGPFLATAQLLVLELGPPPLPLLALLAALLGLWIERSASAASPPSWVAPLGAGALAVLLQAWLGTELSTDRIAAAAGDGELLLRLAIPVTACAVLHAVAMLRSRRAPPAGSPTQAPGGVVQASEIAALAAALIGVVGLLLQAPLTVLSSRAALCFGTLLVYSALVLVQSLRRLWLPLWLVTLGAGAALCALWSQPHLTPASAPTLLGWAAALYVGHLALPLLLLWLRPTLRQHRSLYLTAALAGPALFGPMLEAWRLAHGATVPGLLPALLAVGAGAAFFAVRGLKLRAGASLPEADIARRHLGNQALFALASLGFVAVAIPMQLRNEWVAIAWAVEAMAVWWLYRGLPHLSLKYLGALLYLLVLLALIPSAELLHYHPRGLPVANWLLYSYGVPVLCFLVGAAGLRRVEAAHRAAFERTAVPGLDAPFSTAAYYAGLLLLFALINLEITDAFSTGTYVELWQERGYARDLTRSVAWGLYAIGLLLVGVRQRSKAQRYFSLAFMLLTILKVFLYDLANVGGLYRALSFLGLAVSLILVSLLYQRFVFPRGESPAQPPPPAP